MKKKHNKYAEMGLRALKRAAAKVAEDARRNNYKLPIWINGRIEYEIPGKTTEEETERGSESSPENRIKANDTV